jgi:hypothetical protein
MNNDDTITSNHDNIEMNRYLKIFPISVERSTTFIYSLVFIFFTFRVFLRFSICVLEYATISKSL